MRTAIIGAGSLGTIIGALMAKGGRPADLIDTDSAHVEALNRDGARHRRGRAAGVRSGLSARSDVGPL